MTVHQIPPEKNIGSMMLSGELDATLLYFADRNLVDRSTVDLWNHPDIQPLFPDAPAEGARYFRKTGVFPINHAMVVRRSLAEKNPWVALNLFKAFERAGETADRQRIAHVERHLAAGLIAPEAAATLRTPLLRHGIKVNRAALETLALYSHEQGLTPRPMPLGEVFARSTLDL